MPMGLATPADDSPPTAELSGLPAEMIERILSSLDDDRDLASASAASRLFRGTPPNRSPIERVLRERARARGHEHALPAALPRTAGTWVEELFARERVFRLARAHAHAATCGCAAVNVPIRLSAFVDEDGGLHTCGEHGGMPGADERRFVPAALGHPRIDDAPVRVPTRVGSLSDVRVRAVAAGTTHLLALSDAGAMYACGENRFGQLGLADRYTRYAFVPVPAPAPRDELFVCIAAGSYHSLALTAAGRAYSWGANFTGQLGHGDSEERWEPRRIEAMDGVRLGGLAAGTVHTLLLSSRGAVYSCGGGYNGRLGHGDEEHQHSPRRIDALAGVRAVHVCAGDSHTIVVDDAGGVHSCGRGDQGCLGHIVAARLLPARIEALAGVHAVRASAGHCSSAVVGADGSVHTFGDNEHFFLAHAGPPIVAPPTRLRGLDGQRVLSCALGSTYALYATADGGVYSGGRSTAALGHAARPGHDSFLRNCRGLPPERIAQLPRLRCD